VRPSGLDATNESVRNVSSAWGLPDLIGGASRPMRSSSDLGVVRYERYTAEE
jgi:hypothetical protein